EFTSNPAVVGSARGLLQAFPDLRADVRWIVAEDDMVVVFHDVRGTQAGPWLFVREPRTASADVVHARIKFDDAGQVIDQWLGSNFVEMLAQLGWGFAPLGAPPPPP